jgi:serine/threonine-protein kinase HipA
MMTSTSSSPREDLVDRDPREGFVWVWLPGAADPVVAGRIAQTSSRYDDAPVCTFGYGRSYLARPEAVSLFSAELPLRSGVFDPTEPEGAPLRDPLPIASCLRDASPDAWGRRVLNNRLSADPTIVLSDLTYLLRAGSDRIGAMDVTTSPSTYTPDPAAPTTLHQLLRMSELIEAGEHVPLELQNAARHGSTAGGAQPKALLVDGNRSLISKFPSITQVRPALQAEAVAMLLAEKVGITVAPVEMVPVDGRDVLLVERFDRPGNRTRRMMVSALTVLGYGDLASRHATYPELADAIRTSFVHPAKTLRELYTRMVFNVCVGNSDDHLRNHSAFWDGHMLALTPAYDIAPGPRAAGPLSHALGITREGHNASQLRLVLAAAPDFLLDRAVAADIIDHVITEIRAGYTEACDRARVNNTDRQSMWGREFLNAYIHYDQP